MRHLLKERWQELKEAVPLKFPERLFEWTIWLLILGLTLLTFFLPLPQNTKFQIYILALLSAGGNLFYFHFLPRKLQAKIYFLGYGAIILVLTLFIYLTRDFGPLLTLLYFIPLMAAATALSLSGIILIAIFSSLGLTLVFFLLHPTYNFSQIISLLLRLSSLWFVAFFAHFLTRKALIEHAILDKTLRKLKSTVSHEKKMEEFFSVISHEIKNPLTLASFHLERVLWGKTGKISGETATSLKEALEANQEVAKMVSNILEAARLDVGRVKFEKKIVSLPKVVSETVSELKPQFKDSGLYLNYQKPKAIPKVLADPEKIKEILLNLLLNALKFTPKGGVEVRHFVREEDLVTEVADTGVGIPKGEIRRIFKKFSSAGKKRPGLGLGLYIAAEYLKNMEGEIWCRSVVGQGSTFYFALPLAKR